MLLVCCCLSRRCVDLFCGCLVFVVVMPCFGFVLSLSCLVCGCRVLRPSCPVFCGCLVLWLLCCCLVVVFVLSYLAFLSWGCLIFFYLVLSCVLCLVLSCLALSCFVLCCVVLSFLSCPVLSCPVLSCLSCLVLFYLVLYCHVLSCLVSSCLVLSCLVSYLVSSCLVMSRLVLLFCLVIAFSCDCGVLPRPCVHFDCLLCLHIRHLDIGLYSMIFFLSILIGLRHISVMSSSYHCRCRCLLVSYSFFNLTSFVCQPSVSLTEAVRKILPRFFLLSPFFLFL